MAGRKRSPLMGSGSQAELARQLRDLRDGSGLTLRQLAAKSGYSSGVLSQAESGRSVASWELPSHHRALPDSLVGASPSCSCRFCAAWKSRLTGG